MGPAQKGQSVWEVSEMDSDGKHAKDWRKCREYKSVRQEILKALGGKGVVDSLTLSRLDEYMDFWVLRHQLQDDIAVRGLYVSDDRGRISENRSVSLSIQASRQMSAISAALGLVIGAARLEEADEL